MHIILRITTSRKVLMVQSLISRLVRWGYNNTGPVSLYRIFCYSVSSLFLSISLPPQAKTKKVLQKGYHISKRFSSLFLVRDKIKDHRAVFFSDPWSAWLGVSSSSSVNLAAFFRR